MLLIVLKSILIIVIKCYKDAYVLSFNMVTFCVVKSVIFWLKYTNIWLSFFCTLKKNAVSEYIRVEIIIIIIIKRVDNEKIVEVTHHNPMIVVKIRRARASV